MHSSLPAYLYGPNPICRRASHFRIGLAGLCNFDSHRVAELLCIIDRLELNCKLDQCCDRKIKLK